MDRMALPMLSLRPVPSMKGRYTDRMLLHRPMFVTNSHSPHRQMIQA